MKMARYNNMYVLISCLLLMFLSAEAVRVAPGPTADQGIVLESEKFIDKISESKEPPNPIAVEICAKTNNSALCQQVIKEIDNQAEVIDSKAVAFLQILAVVREIDFAQHDAEKLGAENKESSKGCAFCAGSYKKASNELKNALKSCNENDMIGTITLIQCAMKHITSCEQELEHAFPTEIHFKAVNDFMSKVCDNAIHIANIINTAAIKQKKL